MDISDLSTFFHKSVMVLLVLVQETEEFAHGKRLVRNLLLLILSHISFLEPNFCQLDGVYLVMDRIVDLRVLSTMLCQLAVVFNQEFNRLCLAGIKRY